MKSSKYSASQKSLRNLGVLKALQGAARVSGGSGVLPPGVVEPRDEAVHRSGQARRRRSVSYHGVARHAALCITARLTANVFVGSLADIAAALPNVCFAPESGHHRTASSCPLSARTRLMHRSKQRLYSITSSARNNTEAATVRPNASAVRRFTIIFVGSSAGTSAGKAPLRTFATIPPSCL
jgi:hypothetical protein